MSERIYKLIPLHLVRFFACPDCGAVVEDQDREKHDGWHEFELDDEFKPYFSDEPLPEGRDREER